MHLTKVDPRALKDNPDRTRQTKASPQADALLLATIKAVGIIQPPVIFPESGGGNGYIIDAAIAGFSRPSSPVSRRSRSSSPSPRTTTAQ